MRFKILLVLAISVFFAASASAVPAWKGVITRTQPDGTKVRLELHGDEFFSWTTLAGTSTVVEEDESGYWRPATIDGARRRAAMQRREKANRERYARLARNAYSMTQGERHIPVLLVSFPDVPFTITSPQQEFYALLNETGYSSYGSTGSVRDYYSDNSHGAFTPVFDVFGPVELPNQMSYYGAPSGQSNDVRPEMALYHAAKALDDAIDFSQYDYDSDGMVDMVLFYYAGYNQAEGGNRNTIWPHQWNMLSSSSSEARNARFDGKRIGPYFCTSELRGNNGAKFCGIGTTCHEFAHSLGLPDFYDANYADDGECGALYAFSLMCEGCYNNNSRTPPYLNAEERIMLGWMEASEVREIPEGDVAFTSVKDNVTYKTLTDTEGEYFLYECRDGSGWDSPLPKGMVVYHVDKSTTHMIGRFSAYDLWENCHYLNSINNNGSHPCFYVIPAANPLSLYFKDSANDMVFPGSKRKTSYTPMDWDGNNTGVTIKNISYDSGAVSLSAEYNIVRRISGLVTDLNGKPLEGVYVVFSEPSEQSSGTSRAKAPKRSQTHETLTDLNGYFVMEMNDYKGDKGHLSFSKSGFKTMGVDFDMEPRMTRVDVQMSRADSGQRIEYSYYDRNADQYMFGDGESNSMMAAFRIPAAELPQSGGYIRSFSFYPIWRSSGYYLVVDSGKERIFTGRLGVTPGQFTTINIDSVDIEFSSDEDLYVGLAIENATVQPGYEGYLFVVTEGADNCYCAEFNLEKSDWGESLGYALVQSAVIEAKNQGDTPPEPEVTSLAEMGFNSISDPGKGKYEAGTAFALDLDLAPGVSADYVTWTFDGKDVTGAKSVTLNAGRHTITAVLKTSDGGSEVLQLVLEI